jgi:hypothetical protein
MRVDKLVELPVLLIKLSKVYKAFYAYLFCFYIKFKLF